MYAEFAARRPDQDSVADDERCHGDRFTGAEIGHSGLPQLFTADRVHGDGVPIEQVVDDFTLGIDGAAVHGVAAGDTDRGGIHVGTVFEAQRIIFLAEIECVQNVGIGRHDVKRVVDDQRLALVAAEHAGGEGPGRSESTDVLGRDFSQAAEAGCAQILARANPLAIVLRVDRARQRRRKQQCAECGSKPGRGVHAYM